jgi:hypothetical protein
MAIMIYALYTYHWRAASIRTGGRGPYDDRFGPVSSHFYMTWDKTLNSFSGQTVLCIALLGASHSQFQGLALLNIHAVAIIVNFILRFTDS